MSVGPLRVNGHWAAIPRAEQCQYPGQSQQAQGQGERDVLQFLQVHFKSSVRGNLQ